MNPFYILQPSGGWGRGGAAAGGKVLVLCQFQCRRLFDVCPETTDVLLEDIRASALFQIRVNQRYSYCPCVNLCPSSAVSFPLSTLSLPPSSALLPVSLPCSPTIVKQCNLCGGCPPPWSEGCAVLLSLCVCGCVISAADPADSSFSTGDPAGEGRSDLTPSLEGTSGHFSETPFFSTFRVLKFLKQLRTAYIISPHRVFSAVSCVPSSSSSHHPKAVHFFLLMEP